MTEENKQFEVHLQALEAWENLTLLIEKKHGVNPTTILRQIEEIGASMVNHELQPQYNKGWEALGIDIPITYIESPIFEHILEQMQHMFQDLPEIARGPMNMLVLSALIVCNSETVSRLHKAGGPVTRKLDAIRFVAVAAYLHNELNAAMVEGEEQEKKEKESGT